ncbi:uncharacterized protein [Lolium perenne]|uniref:uncharacterized protein isoform X1 n=1 Tax=Lolium perenne TaxID=4522 RepID=UPI0021F5C5B9|nr:uncharacterized protein LOC127322793 isoform X2 [Lolium perenne]XP_051207173.1 uncharacterized protein LOC127322793 isoform X2 [Lolium perenne]
MLETEVLRFRRFVSRYILNWALVLCSSALLRYDGGQMGFETRGKAGWSFEGLWFGGGMCLSWRKWLQYPFERWSGHKISSWYNGGQMGLRQEARLDGALRASSLARVSIWKHPIRKLPRNHY